MNLKPLLTALLLSIGAFSAVQGATTYYVATTGKDSNPGSANQPWATLSHAAAAASTPGDTVVVMNGTYSNEGVVSPNNVVTLSHSGTAGAPITFMAQNRGQAILDSGNTATGTTCNGAYAYLNLNNAAYIVIQGFVIQNACSQGIESNNSAHDIIIRWNTIQYIANHVVTSDDGQCGIFMNGTEYNFTFDGNTFANIGRTSGLSYNDLDHGIYSHSQNVTIVNNVFYNISKGWAIQQASGAENWLIANNTFAFPSAGDGQIMLWNNASGLTIENNIFYEPLAYAIDRYTSELTDCEVNNNVVYGATKVMGQTNGCTLSSNMVGDNPMFINPTAFNFELQNASPAITEGVYLSSVPDDFTGAKRPIGSTTAAGAYDPSVDGGPMQP
jgi:hypothetical protein